MFAVGVGMMAAAAVGCRTLRPPVPLNQLDAQQARGRELYEEHCARCHYDRKGGALHGPTMQGVFQDKELPSGAAATDERVTATILHGRGMMPAMGGKLGPGDVEDVVAYLHTL